MAFETSVHSVIPPVKRLRIWYALIVFILAVYGVRLFYVQVIRHDHYKQAALSDQLKQKLIPASRGTIQAYDGDKVVPLVLNQKLYTIFADPVDIKTYKTDPEKAASAAALILGGQADEYLPKITAKDTRYSRLAQRVTREQRDALMSRKFAGIYSEELSYRTYPQGSLASQVLGFVNNEGKGSYGLEQALDKQLKGTSGELRAITDLKGVPLAASRSNVQIAPKNGETTVLTLDLGMQQQLETIIAQAHKDTKAESVSAVIIDPNSGAVKAMANYPSFDPAKYDEVADGKHFNNLAVTEPIEVGSIMKSLTTAAALNQGVITPNTTYADPSIWHVDDAKITNIEEDGGPGTRSIADILNLSLNTGATWELMQMGGGELNRKARDAWYDYMTNHYQFGKETGIEQGYESPGTIPRPENNGSGINLTYANTAFGQAMTATPLQMAAALAAVVNGGTYYRPHLVDKTIDSDGKAHAVKPVVVRKDVVTPAVGQQMIPLLQYVVDNHNIVPKFDQSKYTVGGKTGTAEVAKPGGGYYDNVFNGTYLGFVGGDKPEYVIAVFVQKPHINGYAGSQAAQPVFAKIGHMLINNLYVTPKSH